MKIRKYCNLKKLKYSVFLLFLLFLFLDASAAKTSTCAVKGEGGIFTCLPHFTKEQCDQSRGIFSNLDCENFLKSLPPAGFTEAGFRLAKVGQFGLAGAPLEQTIGGIIKGALLLVGTIFLILMVYGGYIWMLARGEEEEAKRAQNIITMAVIGIAVVMAAYAITYFIVYRLTAATM